MMKLRDFFSFASAANRVSASLLVLISFMVATEAQAQNLQTVRKTVGAERLTHSIQIDGSLEDEAWESIRSTQGFQELSPQPGTQPQFDTEVRFAFDDAALYIGARMQDDSPDSILHQLSERDRMANTDEFGIWFSTFDDGLNAVRFSTTPDGVQVDEQLSPENNDQSWDAVWDVACQIDSLGWTAEFRIPWMAFRFPDETEQTWGMNMYRTLRRSREESVWNPMDPTQKLLNQGGILRGISNIDPPLRLSLFPYLSAYGVSAAGEISSSYNGGMDLKVGLGNAFTLDMTLIPDFGQVVTDALVLNLSPFELRFDENRQFFKEGTDIFNKTGTFYSRRMGEEGRLLNATKISGRTRSGTGLGLLQSVATSEEDTSLVSYTVAVVDQNLPNNGYVTTSGTMVVREGEGYDAWVQAAKFELRNRDNTWSVTGNGSINQKFNAAPSEDDEGHSYGIGIQKISGNFTFDAGHYLESESYDPNDLGFLTAPNEISSFATFNYRMYEPRGRFNRIRAFISVDHNQIETPRTFNNWGLEVGGRATTRNFNTWNLSINSQPTTGNDIFSSRIDGLVWREPGWYSIESWFSSDYRKTFAMDGGGWYGGGDTYRDWKERTLRLAPRIRISDQAMLTYVWKIIERNNERGWLMVDSLGGDKLESVWGRRDNIERTQVLNLTYIFSNRMSLSTRIRHSWSQVRYDRFYTLSASGVLENIDFTSPPGNLQHGAYDVNYNAWSIDMVYRWIFAPGSEINVVWKNQLQQDDVGIPLPSNYRQNFDKMIESGFVNSLSIRAIIFIDYSRFKQGLKGFQG